MIPQGSGDAIMKQKSFPSVGPSKGPCLAVLEEQLRARLSGRVGRFRLLVREHGVVLQGYALSFYAKQLAQQAVMEAGKLPIEANEIQVYRARIPELQSMR
jgi:hypothetical protein